MERPTCLHSIFSGDDKTLERHPPCQVKSILKPSMLGDHVYSEAHLSWCLLDFLCQHLKYTYINVHIMRRTQVYKKQSADTDSRSVTCTGNSEETRCKLQCLLDYVPVEKDLIWDSQFIILHHQHMTPRLRSVPTHAKTYRVGLGNFRRAPRTASDVTRSCIIIVIIVIPLQVPQVGDPTHLLHGSWGTLRHDSCQPPSSYVMTNNECF